VVDRFVQLALRGVDAQLTEQRVHAEGAGLVGDDRDDVTPELLVAGEVAEKTGEGGGGRGLDLAGSGIHLLEGIGPGQRQLRAERTGREGRKPLSFWRRSIR
jgi:hypothetical protein